MGPGHDAMESASDVQRCDFDGDDDVDLSDLALFADHYRCGCEEERRNYSCTVDGLGDSLLGRRSFFYCDCRMSIIFYG